MKIVVSQTDAENWILRMVSQYGYYYWTTGRIPVLPPEKIDRLSKKFGEKYGTLLPPHARTYRKGKGLARCISLAYRLRTTDEYQWYLFATEGAGPVHENEKLFDAREVPVTVGDLRLLEVVRPRVAGGGRRWTWMIDRRIQSMHEKHLHACVREGNGKGVSDGCRYIKGYTMHSGVRAWVGQQIKSQSKLWAKIWPHRVWPGPDPDAPLPILKLGKIEFVTNLAAGDQPGSPDQRHIR